MIIKKLWLPLLAIGLFMACDKEMATTDNPPVMNNGNKPVAPVSPVPPKEVSSSIQGIILDENNLPLAGAQVAYGNTTVPSAADGSFHINNVMVKEAAAVVAVQKSGYFNGYRTFRISNTGKLQYAQIQLLPKKVAGVFDAATGGNITASNAQFSFQPQQVMGADNKPYNGKVSLIYAPINPEASNFNAIIPGDLRGVSNRNTLVGLKSYGMMALEVQGENGEQLHLDTNKLVTFKMTIPASLRNSAPANIPLWHFDEASGLWKEEGSAQKIGDGYVGTVKHFSFWNCDVYFPLINFKVTLQDDNGNALANMLVLMKRNDGSITSGYTNQDGLVSGDIPQGETLTLQIMDQCNNIAYNRNVGPYTNDTNLGTLQVNIPGTSKIQFSGAVTSCNGSPLQNGIVNISLSGIVYSTPVVAGKYNISILYCQGYTTNAIINAVDVVANKISTTTLPVTTGAYIQDLSACDAIQPSTLNFTYTGQNYNFSSPTDSVILSQANYRSLLSASNADKSLVYNIFMDSVSVGTYATQMVNFRNGNLVYSGSGSYTITQKGTLGGYVEGSFSANLRIDSTTNTSSPLTGTFKVRVTQ
ncbi:hypothetical protein ACDQ55_03990 [Chitinophaga sp. 30R24]|uniref:hypothetical protein n=1 Tax=Chitinophaga sp. 30R24 TaxID=3248838 RepID=UPI003B8EB4FD